MMIKDDEILILKRKLKEHEVQILDFSSKKETLEKQLSASISELGNL